MKGEIKQLKEEIQALKELKEVNEVWAIIYDNDGTTTKKLLFKFNLRGKVE